MSKTVVIKNNTSPAIDLMFQGVPVSAGGQVTVQDDNLMWTLAYDPKFLTAIDEEEIIINNGSMDMHPYPAVYYLRERSTSCVEINFSDQDHPYVATSTNFWEQLANFIFSGYNRLGVPDSLQLIVRRTNPTTSYDLSIIDVTSNVDIVNLSSSDEDGIITLTPLTNISAELSVWSIMARCGGGDEDKVCLYSMRVCFPTFANG